MSSEQARTLRQQGIALAKSGQKDEARRLLQQSIRLEPANEAAWLWLASVARDERERAFCLGKVLEINPNNQAALAAMETITQADLPPAPAAPPSPGVRRLGETAQGGLSQPGAPRSLSSPGPAAQVPGSPPPARTTQAGGMQSRLNTSEFLNQPPGVPLPTQDAVIDAQRRAEGIVRAYQSPVQVETQYAPKTRRRAGEADVVRLRLTLAVAALVGVVAFLLIATVVVLSNDDLRSIVIAPTGTFTQTPTVTPTTTPGVTPTPSATPRRAFTPTPALPLTVPTANIYNLQPTAIYPQVLEQPLRDAISLLNNGEAEAAIPTLRAEIANTEGRYNPNPYYFQSLAYIQAGDTDQALDTLADAEDRLVEAPNDNYKPLVDLGYAQTYWALAQRARASGDNADARDYSDQAIERATLALEGDPDAGNIGDTRLADAYVILAQAQAANGDTSDALGTLDQGLEVTALQANVKLLLTKGQVFMQQRDYDRAEYQAFTALYIDPTSEAAYTLQIQAALAQDAPGRAVLYAQNYLAYYPGSTRAFRLLGDARVAEGNPDLALVAYSQGLTGADNADTAAALSGRAGVYMAERRYNEAQSDYTRAFTLSRDTATQAQRMNAAYLAGSYRTVLEDADDLVDRNVVPEAELALLRARAQIDQAVENDSPASAYQPALGLLLPLLGDEGLPASLRPVASEYIARAQLAAGSEDAALQSVDVALAGGETAARHLLRGLILEQQGEPERARRDYGWVVAWGSIYPSVAVSQAEAQLDAMNDA